MQGSEFKASGLRCRVSGLDFCFQGSGLRVKRLGFQVNRFSGFGFRLQVLGFTVYGLGFRCSVFGARV